MKLIVVAALVVVVALGSDAGPQKSRCLRLWEECMDRRDRPTGDQCDDEIIAKHQCVKPSKSGGMNTDGFAFVNIKESKDEEHQEDVSRTKLKSNDKQMAEVSNRDRVGSGAESLRQATVENEDGGSGGSRRGGDRRGGSGGRSEGSSSRSEGSGGRSERSGAGGRRGGRQSEENFSKESESERSSSRGSSRGSSGRGSGSSDGGSSGSGGSGNSPRKSTFTGMDKVTFDKEHEDLARTGSESNIDFERDEGHKKSKVNTAKDSTFIRNL